MSSQINQKFIVNAFRIYACLCVFTIVFLAICFCRVEWNQGHEVEDFSGQWRHADGSTADIARIHDEVSVYAVLPELTDNEMLFLKLKCVMVKAYIDGELICDYGTVEMDKSFKYKAPGSYFVRIPLSSACSGKTIELRLTPGYYNDNSCSIHKVVLGDTFCILHQEIIGRLFDFSACLVLIITGLVFIVLSFVLHRNDANIGSLMYLGIFTIIIGTWAMTETSFLQLMTGNSNFWHLVTGLTLPLALVPLVLFFRERYKNASRLPAFILAVVTIIAYLLIIICQITGIADTHETIRIAHISIFVGAVFTIYYAVRCFIDTKFNDISIWGMIAIAFAVLLDMIFYNLGISEDNSTFSKWGVFIYVWFLGVDIIRDHINAYNLWIKSEMLAKAAYYDVLTDLLNRTSYIEDIRKKTTESKYGTILVIFDMNNLKYINDVHGHTSGDAAIIEAADYISRQFSPMGKCYRIGGDEFAFISASTRISSEKIKENMDALEHSLEKRNENIPKNTPWPLLVASGYAVYNDTCEDFTQVINAADAMMYKRKQELKELYPNMNLRDAHGVSGNSKI